jgi:hypothetical protein
MQVKASYNEYRYNEIFNITKLLLGPGLFSIDTMLYKSRYNKIQYNKSFHIAKRFFSSNNEFAILLSIITTKFERNLNKRKEN